MSAENTGPDEHILSTLSDEERAALAEHEQDKKVDADIAAAAINKGGPNGTDEDEAAAGPAAPAAAAPAQAPSDPDAADAAAQDAAAAPAAAHAADASEPEQLDDIEDEPLPVLPAAAKLPDDFKEKMDALAAREAEADQKLDDGEIDLAEHRRQLRTIADERRPLERLQVKAELAQEMHQEAEVAAYRKAAQGVIDLGKKQGVDYIADEAKWADLRGFAEQLEQRHPDKPPSWLLREAHRRVLALHDIKPAPEAGSAPAPAPKVDKLKDAMANRRPDVAAAPASLAQVPGGDGPGDVQSEFADILALEGDDYEAAVGRLTPAQRERFAAVG